MRLFLTLLLATLAATALAQSKWTPYTESNSRVTLYIQNAPGDAATFRNVVRLYTTATIGDAFFERTYEGISTDTMYSFDCEEWDFEGVQNGSMIFTRSRYMTYRYSNNQLDGILLDPFTKATVGSKDWGRYMSIMCSRDKAYNRQIMTDTLYIPIPTSPGLSALVTPASLWNRGFLSLSFNPEFDELTAALH